MRNRQLILPTDQHFFLLGPRGTGKSSLLRQQFDSKNPAYLWIDLLNFEEEDRLTRNPDELKQRVLAASSISHIIIDEIQKIPRLLDVIHHLIETTDKYFIMTGSSARKLKRGHANLLAGRAFVYHLFPFSFEELEKDFNLDQTLQWGLLPRLFQFSQEEEKKRFLQAYTHTYLKEEIWAEQFIKKLAPFRRFLEVAAQCNGKIINYANIARDVGIDDKTVKDYFSLLEDTLLGFFLEPFQHSFRKRLHLKPKFYFFDIGVTRALSRTLSPPINPKTSAYGEAFEHFIIIECLKQASYHNLEFRFSYLKTKDDAEIDLIIERPGLPLACIEIKSAAHIIKENLSSFEKLTNDLGDVEAFCFSNDPNIKLFGKILALPWYEGIRRLFKSV